ncbi:uncharacterized protein TRIADDRAFT_59334 [Trichoplax adhaerens]|uniref:Uncharacterized protein n=1 Tax=Trichoplax adhaerens TaxID=10228 RepID=B3S4T1_TRIAD|nr:hypothetical protein TRIADDRAFT_59334 [Trichoplax adhaerens]EDV22268.1 hypothetical protein TRIADDRAFT_59334 [Trichoplax adhaerens]|eukprot:XP_002115423.1 hypothetical protein TRIADDRAFT_59334 [Trichoplax adhaerens]
MANKDVSPETLPTGDDEFEPTVEMMMDDFDDEQTMEDEELQDDVDADTQAEELALLEEEGDMPLEQLMAMYGYGETAKSQQKDESSGEEDKKGVVTASFHKIDEPEIKTGEKRKRDNDDEYVSESAGSGSGSDSRDLVNMYNQADANSDESDESDSDYEPLEWKKEIRVGPEYQAEIPEYTLKSDKKSIHPALGVVKYLSKYCQPSPDVEGITTLPLGNHNKDDDKALFILLQNNFDVDKAINHKEHFTGECLSDSRLKLCGKNFYQIRQSLLPTRSVGEIVQFYYLWKKTERYDAFTMQLNNGKRKGYFQPGVTDYMDRFLDENEVDAHLNPYERAQPLNPSEPLNNNVIAGGSLSSRFPVGLRVPNVHKPDNYACDEQIILNDLYHQGSTEDLEESNFYEQTEDNQGSLTLVKNFDSETTTQQDSTVPTAD